MFFLATFRTMSTLNAPPAPALFVACLCAQWCGTCKDYAPVFARLQHEFPLLQWRWVDIENEADLVDPIEVENFPTLLIATNGQVRFFGSVTPHPETLKRLVQSHATNTGPSRLPPDVQTLADRLLG
ncbi:MAG: thioredoxin family protein [Rhodoferax sp.]|nr:thioredoxin family protein [Rhodoferax sp.]